MGGYHPGTITTVNRGHCAKAPLDFHLTKLRPTAVAATLHSHCLPCGRLCLHAAIAHLGPPHEAILHEPRLKGMVHAQQGHRIPQALVPEEAG